MTDILDDIHGIVKANRIYRFGMELANIKDELRKTQIKQIMEKLENKNLTSKERTAKMFDDLNIMAYKQSWNKLQDFHKEDRIKLFVLEKYEKHKNKNQLENLLLDKLKDGYFKTTKNITYENAKISTIHDLVETEIGFEIKTEKKTKTKKTEKLD